jgi:xylulokinase
MRGGFTGIGLDTARADIARSLYEGVAINAAWLLPHVAALADVRWTSIRIGGGGALSPLWAQIFADVLGITVERVVDPRNTNARGAALLAHAHPHLAHLAIDDIPRLIAVEDRHEPQESTRSTYDKLITDHAALHQMIRPFYADRRRSS